jgi:tRNA G10  N-methylase Trm11
MNRYYSTFITGFQEIVENELKVRLKDVQIDLVLDGLIVYRTKESLEKITNLRFLNNTFILFNSLESKSSSVEKLINKFLKDSKSSLNFPKEALKGKRSFRIIASKENQIVSIDKKLLEKLEIMFSKNLRLQVNRSLPDVEVWFLERSEGYGFVGLRVTKTSNYEKTLHKGELRPELANLMCILAELKKSDVVLDPFAGYGAIPFECARGFEVKKIMAGEKDRKIFKILQEKTNTPKQKIVIGKWDALNLKSLTDDSVDKIITDPPWGFYDDKDINLEKFYRSMLGEFIRVLKPNGFMVLLMAQKEMFEEMLTKFPTLEIQTKYTTLVSGKKATVYKIRKH